MYAHAGQAEGTQRECQTPNLGPPRSAVGPCAPATCKHRRLPCYWLVFLTYVFCIDKALYPKPEKPTGKTLGLREHALWPSTQPCTSLMRTCTSVAGPVSCIPGCGPASRSPHSSSESTHVPHAQCGPLRETSLGGTRFASLETVVQSAAMHACLKSFQL